MRNRLIAIACTGAALLAMTAVRADAKAVINVATTGTTVTGTAITGGPFIVSSAAVQPGGTGVFGTFLRLQQATGRGGPSSQERGYNTSAGFPLDDQPPVNFTHALELGAIPIVNIGGIDYRQFLLDVAQPGNGNISLNQVQIFQSAADVGTTSLLSEADSTDDAVISFPVAAGANEVFRINNQQNNTTDLTTNTEIVVNSGHGNGEANMFLYVPNADFANTPTSFVTLFSQFGTPTGTFAAAGSFEEWGVGAVPEPMSLIVWGSLCGIALLAYRLRSRA